MEGHRPRARELELAPGAQGRLQPGPLNAITDVAGVSVGHCTIVDGVGDLSSGRGPVRTGVTAIVPHAGNTFADKVPAAVHVINGFGKAVGFLQVDECGVLETPILLTNTLSVGRVADGLVEYMLQDNPDIGVTTGTVNAVVGECNDGYLNDIRGRHVDREHVFSALADAKRGPVAEGAVGAGTGMTAFGWKGGIGTASRFVPVGGRDTCGRDAVEQGATEQRVVQYVLGALVLSNFGSPRDLIVGGWPVGRFLPDSDELSGAVTGASCSEQGRVRDKEGAVGLKRAQSENEHGDGSVVIVIATDAPVDARQLRRIAARSVVGIVRCGSRLSHGSGDYAIAFSTARHIAHTFDADSSRRDGGGDSVRRGGSLDSSRPSGSPLVATDMLPDDGPVMAGLLRAAGEVTEEAVLNSMLKAHTVVGRDGHVRRALPVDELVQLIRGFESP